MKRCKFCNNLLHNKRNQFCNRSCSSSFNNRKRRSKRCKNCNKLVENSKNKYCNDCIEKQVYNLSKTLDECKTDKTRRKFLIRKYGHVCMICLNAKWNGKEIPLELDHINGDHSNNSEENLRIICPNCHAQTETYKGANKGNGRKNRKPL